MKKIIIVLSLFSSFSSALASTEGLARALKTKVLVELESKMKTKEFSLKSISDEYAGEAFFPSCDCEDFVVTFQKSSGDPFSKEGVKKEVKEFVLSIWEKGTDGTIEDVIK